MLYYTHQFLVNNEFHPSVKKRNQTDRPEEKQVSKINHKCCSEHTKF